MRCWEGGDWMVGFHGQIRIGSPDESIVSSAGEAIDI
jgi:hypothetical protein